MLFKKGGVRSHLIEEGACNKNYCSEPTVFSKISKPDRHLIKALSSQKKKKIKRRQQQQSVSIFSPSRKKDKTTNYSFFGTKFVNCMLI